MKSIGILLLGFLFAALMCTPANAHSISTNDWQTVSTQTGNSATIDPTDIAPGASGFPSLSGVNDLSFSPGVSLDSYVVGVMLSEPSEVIETIGPIEYAWGGDANSSIPEAQILFLQGISSSTFTLDFYYDSTKYPNDSGAAHVASLTVNDTTYTTKIDPSLLPDTANSLTFLDGVLSQVDGVAVAQSDFGSSWSVTTANGSGAMSAPELDPASMGGGLTLLAGLIAILRGRRR
jgi:hypothetical protein